MKKIMLCVLVIVMFSSLVYGDGKTCELKLNVYDRLKIIGLLPQKANFEKAMLISDIKAKLNLTQTDIVLYEIKTEGDSIKWNAEGTERRDFVFTEIELQVIKDSFQEMNSKNEVEATPSFLELYKKVKNAEGGQSEKVDK